MNQVESLKRRNLVLAVVAVLLLAFLVFRPSTTSAVGTDAYPELFPDLKAEEVRTFSLTRVASDGDAAADEKLRIARDGEASWSVASSFGYPANPDKVSRFLEELQSSRRKKFITDRQETFDDYAPAAGWIEVEVQGPGGAPMASFALGKSAGWPDSFVRIEEDGKPVVVRAYNLSSSDVRLGVQSWTDAGLWHGLTLPAVLRIDVHQREEKQILSFARGDREIPWEEGDDPDLKGRTEKVWGMVAPKVADPEQVRVEGLVRAFTGMRFDSIVARESGEAADKHFGLDEPTYRVVAFGPDAGGGESDVQEYVLLVGSEVPPEGEGESPDRWYVRREGDAWVFEVGSMAIADFRQGADEYLPVPEEPEEPEAPGDAHGSPDDEDGPGDPIPPGDTPPMPPEDPD